MLDCTINLKRIMDTYLMATENGSFFFDIRLNLILSNTDYTTVNELSDLGFDHVLSFLSEKFSKTVSDKRYFAFFLHDSIICHIVFIVRNNNYIGAIVSDPIIVRELSDVEFDEFTEPLHLSEHKKSEIRKLLMRKKTIVYEKAISYGTVLYSLSTSLMKENAPIQIIKSNQQTVKKSIKPSSISENRKWNVKGIERHIPSSTYLSLKQAIQEGDTQRLLDLINQQSASFAPVHQFYNTDHIRSIKNSCIKLCSMACYTAIDAGAPYVQTLDMTDEMILRMELTNNITEIYEMMKNVLATITNAVSKSKKSIYSQPVRKIIDYLYSHYSEKITLEDLSNLTRLSTYYISNLIKSETGLSLNDNINNIRIEQSKKLLLEKNSSILEVAQSVGFHYQNHFAAVFKKYCGISPSDYRNAHGISFVGMTSMTENAYYNLISQIVFQIKTKLTIFDGHYDVARIVNPIEHTTWVISGEEIPNESACYYFWNNNESCQNCISIRAYVQNDTFFKLEQKEKQTYLVLAFPEHIGKSVYITELLKDISNQSIINIAAAITNPLLEAADKSTDKQTGFYTRYYIDKHLPLDIRRSKAEREPLTLITVVFTLPELSNDIYEFLPLLSESAHACLPGPEDWIGHYAGNILLYVLHGKADEQIQEINHLIQTTLKGRLNSIGFSDIGVQTADQHLSQEVFEAGELFYLLFAKLHAKAQSDT
ncbi:helix-turn-helix transcriptional regulator [Anaerocolumna chitinilytica]|uniref:HTH araC/xylS-type domain-containing protein n=1 Tax=Anaerocolumna chitinilytica TaxID=1727145 RepID=A0A7I8DQI7_9FIRM|nr:AraC family transcriptional regulator [Anaerocolumna chitinilytica]BCK00691.1 hypothetical protein bsdcttw_37310 [Anaerocolumna chitinilytica]